MNEYNLSFKNNQYYYPFCPTKIQTPTSQKGQLVNASQNLYPMPVYTEIPYGISKNGYIKLGVQKLPTGEELHIYALQNGQKAGIIKGQGCPIVQVQAGVGSFDEPRGKEGISHLIEHSLFHSSKKYTDIEEAIKKIGGYSNASTTTQRTQYYITLNNGDLKNIEQAIDIQADMFFNPEFSKLEKEKAIVTAEANMYEADEQGCAINKLKKDLFSLPNDSPNDNIAGNAQTIASINVDDMFQYHNNYYTPSNSCVFVKSPIEPDEIIKIVAQKFNSSSRNIQNTPIQRKNLAPIDSFKRFDYISKDSSQKTVMIGFNVPYPNNPKENFKLGALVKLIAHRTGLNATSFEVYNHRARVIFDQESEKINEYEIFYKLQEEFRKILLNPPSNYELEKIRNSLFNEIDECYKNNESTADVVCCGLLDSYNLSQEKDAINSLTVKDIQDAIKYFNLNACSIGVIHPCTTTQEQIQQAYEKNKNALSPVVISKVNQQFDITKSLTPFNIEPYSSKKIYSAKLPDNTTFCAFNSKTDKCSIYWKLYNPNMQNHNIAAKYVLDAMGSSIGIEDKYNMTKNNITAIRGFDGEDGPFFFATCQYDDIEEAIRLLKKNFDIDFSQEDFEDAKKYALEEINRIRQSAYHTQKAQRYGRLYNNNIDDLKKELESLTLEDLKRYYNDLILNSYSTVSIAAPFNDDLDSINKAANAINVSNFAFKKEDKDLFKNTYSKKQEETCYVREQKTGQPEFQKIYNFKNNGNIKDDVTFKLLNSILSKRIYNLLREKEGLAYIAQSFIDKVGNDGSIVLDVLSNCTNPNDVQKIFDGFDEITKDLMSKPVSKEELEEAKNTFKREEYSLFDDTLIAQTVISYMLNTPVGLTALSHNFKVLDRITQSDIQNAACYVFNETPDYSIDANKKLIDENLEYFNKLGTIKR